MAALAACRSGESSARVELTKTRRRWSGVRMPPAGPSVVVPGPTIRASRT
jgi:hypothetical protein